MGQKCIFSNIGPEPFGMLEQVFSACFEPVVTCCGPWKIPKLFEYGPLCGWTKNVSKTLFSKSDRGLLGVHKQMKMSTFLAQLEAFLAPLTSQKL